MYTFIYYCFVSGKKSEAVTKILHEYFESVPNPYSSALKIASNCPDFYQSKAVSLPFTGKHILII